MDAIRTAFERGRESPKTRDRYGQRALLARRLVEHGASWVTLVLENATPPGAEMKPNHCYWPMNIDPNRTSFPDGSGRPMPLLPYGDAIGELV